MQQLRILISMMCAVSTESINTLARIHTKENTHHYEVCNKKFRLTGSLKTHAIIHTEEKPYQCCVCSELFNAQGEKPCQSGVCTKKFGEYGTIKHVDQFTERINLVSVECAVNCSTINQT